MNIVIPNCSAPISTSEPYTSPVANGAWTGEIGIPISENQEEKATIRFLVTQNGMTIDYYQLEYSFCGMTAGDTNIPIVNGMITFTIDQSCDFNGTITIMGTFTSVTTLQGTIVAGNQTSTWEAVPAK